ncbi:CDP-diacylglycerol--glycerol-3-phosphate 3-phosphatidyltransferase [Aliibacillus thermotolerans]|uniref:CDP-diacylglycerol--glycerol-3-phosphate 3-phosphatidyltransferase n=1 Tax=Aliibacillus thermotolerans TaxID=1834418 RepID=A0ABW0U7E2_9BACI|nr:CDP-diacylglycerol--glycerol-3-phosphate 3-phosphatidyltransferase [Aliibacillus thermotolerans]MDA3130548.1 CDP-diacylglycerol--glycerol-3-phosphate 3-phosphatidyltransferase [Aliibacillus thermotolerans]
MNLPNKITLARIFLIPLFMIFMFVPFPLDDLSVGGVTIPLAHLIGAIIFLIAAGTDWLDGYYARKYHLVTNFGKFLDPLADKLLVTAAFLSLVEWNVVPAWMVIIILSREFAVTGIRLVAAADGEVIAASPLGKWKTIFQMLAIIVLLFYNIPFAFIGWPIGMILLWIAVILTIISGIDYFIKNKHVFTHSM